jgi:manganese/iron transport system ATP-binding protein
MDEPLTGLDTPSQEGLLNLLDRLRNQNVTVMVATHDLEQAARHFDRMLLLNHRIVAMDTPDKVLQTKNLLHAYGGRLRPAGGENVMAVDDYCDEGEDEHTH